MNIAIGTVIEKLDVLEDGSVIKGAYRLEIISGHIIWKYIGRGYVFSDPDLVFLEFPLKCDVITENGEVCRKQ